MLDVRNIDERLLNDDKDLEVNVSAGEYILKKEQIEKLAEMFKKEYVPLKWYRSPVWVR